MKSEPDAFSWDQQVANGVEPWTGVRNHMAKNNLKAMQKGDLAFFYHSNIGKEIVGIVRWHATAYPDPTAEKGDWVCVDMKAVRPLPKPVSLEDIKADPAFADLALVRHVAAVGDAGVEGALGQAMPDGRLQAMSGELRDIVPARRPAGRRRQGVSRARRAASSA